MLFLVGKKYRLLTVDGFRYGGAVLEYDAGMLRLHDDKSGRQVLVAVSTIARAEEMVA